MAQIYDNIEVKFTEGLRGIISSIGVKRVDFCVGYFNLRGWNLVVDQIDNLPGDNVYENDEKRFRTCRLLIGMHRPPEELIRQLYSGEEYHPDSNDVQDAKLKIAEDFRRQLLLGLPTNADQATLRKLSRQLKEKKVCVKLYLREPLHAKLYLAYRPDDHFNPIPAILGSSNLTYSGLTKQGELLWKEFLDTCNKFFEARNKQNAGSRSEEHANLDKKRNIIAQLKELVVAEITDNDFQKKLKDFAKQYSAIGHVPFKEKDKVYKEYHEAIDAAYEKLHATNAKRHFDNFKNNLKNVAKEGGNALGNERGKLLRRYDQLRSEITTYENNLGFFNTASKKGNSLVEEMNRKIEKLKADLEMVKQKIKAIDAEKK